MKFFFSRKDQKKYNYFIDFCKNYIKIIRASQKKSTSAKEEIVIDKIYTLNLEEVSEEKVNEFFSQLFHSNNNLNLTSFILRKNATIRYLRLPSKEPKEIDKMIAFQVEKKIPYNMDEITYEYKIQFVDNEGYSHLMLVIAHKRRVQNLIHNFEQYNLNLDFLMLDVDALCNWFNFEYKISQVPVGVLDVDINKINLIVVKNGVIDFSRNITMGSHEFEKEENRYALQKLKDVVERSIDVYNKNNPKKLAKIIITGAENNLNLIKDNLQESFSSDVEIKSCFENISLGFASEKFKREGTQLLSFTYLVGGALPFKKKKLNFLPSEKKAEKKIIEKKKIVKKIGGVFFLFMIVIMILVGYNFYYLNKKLYVLDKKLKNISPKAKKISKEVSLLRKLSGYLKDRDYSLNILREIYVRIPKKISLTHLDFSREENVVLKGEAKKISEVFSFVSALEESNEFHSVKADSVNASPTAKENIVSFEIYCELKQ